METDIREAIHRVPVVSSSISEIGHDPELLELQVVMKANNTLYIYQGVTEKVFREFLDSPSKGNFYAQRIRGKYQSMRMGVVLTAA